MAEPTYLRVRKSAWFGAVLIKAGIYDKNSPEVKALPAHIVAEHFEPLVPDFGPVVEQATAAPGEKRTTPRRKPKPKE